MTDQPTMKSPERLRVGDFFGKDKQGNAVYVKELHELCPEFDGPHVHVLTSLGHSCIPFQRPKPHTKFSGEWSGPVWNLKERRYADFKALARHFEQFNTRMSEVMDKFQLPEAPQVGDRVQMIVPGSVTGRFSDHNPPLDRPLDRRRKR